MGLRVGDLENLVRPLISIDEFESKIDGDAIVVGFYVNDNEPAEDLSQFIESSGYRVMDTEVSPGTDKQGDYVVFVEILRDSKFPKTVEDIIDSVIPLTDNKEWSFTYYGGQDKPVPLSVENIQKYVRLEKDMDSEQKETMEYFQPSLLDDLLIDDNSITFVRNGKTKVYEKVALGNFSFLNEAYNLDSEPVNFDQDSLRQCRELRQMLGEAWDVNRIGQYLILANNVDQRVIFLK